MRATPSSRDRADEGGWSVVSSLELFVYNLDLLVDYLPGETVDRHAASPKPWRRRVYPVMLLSFHDEVVLKTRSIWLKVTRLGQALRQ